MKISGHTGDRKKVAGLALPQATVERALDLLDTPMTFKAVLDLCMEELVVHRDEQERVWHEWLFRYLIAKAMKQQPRLFERTH